MAERKKAEESTPAAESPQATAPQIPTINVRVFPIRDPKTKHTANASVDIGGVFAVRGFKIFESKNGPFVKEPSISYVKDNGYEDSSIFFPITAQARETLYGTILKVYNRTMEKMQAKKQEGTDWLMGDEDENTPQAAPAIDPNDDFPFGSEPENPEVPVPSEEDMPAMGM